eukprot:NODE_5361_length_953_cov_30.145783_g5145_i0.p1 GENE.NODE_5361_length_953_cov_30.145783_g5145_i0~~NODE_5361_length_953_cov_30.145783_g5145_i0.p1  ORF type:complete len:269 (-),score=66.47 NODE_5361_length_953_cov_30.145783_g5145_i0:86-892(-)
MAETKTRLLQKLEAMSFPYAFDVDKLEFPHFHKFVMWLEDTQIRALPEDRRAGLKTLSTLDQWWPHFATYCQSLGYKKSLPMPMLEKGVVKPDTPFRMVVDWLVAKAIRYFYGDDNGVERFTAGHEKFKASNPSLRDKFKKKDTKKAFSAGDSQEIKPILNQLLTTLQLTSSGDVATDLAAATRTVKHLGLLSGGKAELMPMDKLLASFPLGFTTGDTQLDNAARVLRILYTDDLRELQDKIDETLVTLQNTTGDPKTDTKLGKVGSG